MAAKASLNRFHRLLPISRFVAAHAAERFALKLLLALNLAIEQVEP